VTGRTLAVFGFALATLAFLIALTARPHDRGIAVDAYVLLAGAALLGVLTRATSRAFPGPVRHLEAALLPRSEQPSRPTDLVRLGRVVEMSAQSAFDTHYRLRPMLREIAAARLARHGLQVDDARARGLLGEAAWEIVDIEARPPSDHFAPGAPLGTIAAALTALEDL
jgi:hypothetical protein